MINMEITLGMKEKVIIIPVSVSALIITASVLIGFDAGIIGNVIVICAFITTIPYFLYKYSEFLWLRAIEKQFPNFIRDLADSKRSGMALTEAIKIASRANYGKLTPEIKRMSNRLSWGTTFMRSLDIFSLRVKSSKIINEAVSIIKESYTSGGNVANTLDSVARDIRLLEEAEEERRSEVRQQVMVMYGIFFIFLGVSISIVYVMVPMMSSTGGGLGSMSGGGPMVFNFVDPCPSGSEFTMPFPCGLFHLICKSLGVNIGISCYYVSLFFSILIIEGIFIGLIAGQIGENSPVSGIKHSLIMVSAAIVIFTFLAKMGILPK